MSVAAGTTVDVSPVNNSNLTVRNSLPLDGAMIIGRADGSTYGQVATLGTGRRTRAAGAISGAGSVTFGGNTSNS